MKLFNVCLSKMPYLDLVHTTHGVVSKKTVFSMRPVMRRVSFAGIIPPLLPPPSAAPPNTTVIIWDENSVVSSSDLLTSVSVVLREGSAIVVRHGKFV